MLYHHGIDMILRSCLTHEEDEKSLNECHSGACGGHLSGYATTRRILRAGYFWPTIFEDCIIVTSVRNATGFTPFQLVYGLEAVLPIQCEISSLKLAIDLLPNTSEEEAHFFELIHLDETRRDATLANKANKKRVNKQYDKNVKPRVYSEGDLVLLYDHESDKIGAGKFKPLWMSPYIVKHVLTKDAYELVDYDGIPLSKPKNGLYLKCYYA
eukprot:PITA_09299